MSFGYLADKPKRNETADEFLKRTKDERGKIIELLLPVDNKIIDTLVNIPALVLKRNRDRVNGELNKEYKGAEHYLDLSGENAFSERMKNRMFRLGDLQIEKNFIRFWNCFFIFYAIRSINICNIYPKKN